MAINYHNHNINTSGTITSPSGNFTTLIVNGTSVSNFNSSVSGLLPTIANSGDNRILTSTGSSVGMNAESNLTFNGSTLGVVGGGSFSSQTVFASGTAAAPGISILGDTDTGLCQISSVGTNSLSISTSGVERVRFTSDGTTQVRANSSNISTLFTYNENGGELVHYDDAQAAATLLDQCNNQTRLLELINGSDLLLGLGGSNTTGSVRFMRAGFSEIMRINSSGNIGIGSSSNNDNIRTRLQVCGPDADDDPSLGSGTGALLVTNSDSAYGMQFGVSADGVGWIQQGRVDGTATAYSLLLNPVGGNVGIGTTTVSYRLHVVGNASATNNITTYLNNTGGTRSRLAFQDTAVSYAPDMGSVGNSLTFDTVGVERVRIDASGNVGIGVTPVASTTSSLQVISDITLYGASRGFFGNVYFQSGFKYAGTGYGWGWVEGFGHVDFQRTSSSGTAGNTATLTTAIRITTDSKVLIGTTTDNGDYKLQVNSQIYATNATIATSDARFKTNVETLNDATTVIEALRPVSFDFLPHTERNFATERQVGLIAQEAQAALAGTDYADSVVAQCGDHLGLAYEKLVPVLIKALQESNARIAALEQRINA